MSEDRDRTALALTGTARAAIAAALGVRTAPPPDSPLLDARRGVFVTLTIGSRLRGCIGRVDASGTLRRLLPEMARAAAFEDPRFPPLSREEYDRVGIEVSVLSPPERPGSPDDIVLGTHGVIVSAPGHRGLLLPQVATEWNWTREELLANACEKAGLASDAWQQPATRIETFTAEVYREAGRG